MYTYIYLYYYK